MTDRLTRIYTRRGDDGTTGLADGGRLSKDSRRIEALGCLDELNSLIGVVIAHAGSSAPVELVEVQHQLFEVGAELAAPGAKRLQAGDVGSLEQALDHHNGRLPPLREFILPGGDLATAHCHLARSVCRRAERRLVELGRSEALNPETLRYINRLSDLLFVLARVLARRDDGREVYWQPKPPT
jgi:cob(I)alamin adenosyltransferase